ncbi:MAG: alpha/beta hydrolase [Actinomycetota bacterium]|nr:alpha/beta hydrolase [Actinomycetota bacterium]
MAEVETDDAVLHVEVDGEGEPVTVLAHGLTNTCRELAQLTPLVAGTKVRFCFRAHGHSGPAASGRYGFVDFARDLDAVASTYGATRALGTSLGAGAICRILETRPDRFERMVFLLPAGLDRPFQHKARFQRTAEILETLPRDEAVAALLADPERQDVYARAPWLREFDRLRWADVRDPAALGPAIRQVIEDTPVHDREVLRAVAAPVLILCREGDPIHPAGVGRAMANLLPHAELLTFPDEVAMFEAMPDLVQKVNTFLAP